jgi:NAD+ kinase
LQQTSTAGSPQPSAEPVRRAAVVVHGHPDRIGDAPERVQRVAEAAGVELTEDSPDLAVVLGGDGTMLRALQRFLPLSVPVIGVNFGRVGFLASMMPDDLEEGLERAFAGDYVVHELPTIEATLGGESVTAINDVVATSAVIGRMGEVEWFVGGEAMGRVPADGVIASTPTGSTAYNLSNGGPVLMWGLDALTITFIAPHSLHARPVVVPRDRPVNIRNVASEIPLALTADGHRFDGDLQPGQSLTVRLGEQRSLLATLPDATFVTRYKGAFA